MIALEVRPATQDDAQFLGWAILTATRSHIGRGWFDIALDRPEDECLAFLERLTRTATRSYWHYSRFFIAQHAGHPVSAVCATAAREAYAATPAAIVETAKSLGLTHAQVDAIWRRGAYMFKCSIRPDDESWMIENIATVAAFRRTGCTASLVDHCIEIGRLQGMRQAQASTFIGNAAAERVLSNAGFRPVQERRDPAFEIIAGAPGIRQHVRPLQS